MYLLIVYETFHLESGGLPKIPVVGAAKRGLPREAILEQRGALMDEDVGFHLAKNSRMFGLLSGKREAFSGKPFGLRLIRNLSSRGLLQLMR